MNCLNNRIPETVCGMSAVEVLSLNGLGSADDCSNRRHVFPFLGAALYIDDLDATIPNCVWSLPNLTLLHMAGNGLVGDMHPPYKMPSSHLMDLVVSHNRLEGTIPVVSRFMQHLDVSYNRLTGELTTDNTVNSTLPSASMISKVNHLSGRLPSHLASVTDLNVLRGNMISCDTIPSNDVHSDTYSCGK